ncbi:MAG: response regulator transcription factor [Oscillospiraceae bacterium]|nr:response regulator transcription factor [Oscillospiraceae bacterium]
MLPESTQRDILRDALTHSGIDVTLAEDVRQAVQILKLHINAFLLLDLSLDGANLFLDEIVGTYYTPPPFLIVTDTIPDNAMRTDVLNRGADVCLAKPIDADEVLAVINAVFRRTVRLGRVQSKLAPCIRHKELLVDPLRRSVVMKGRSIELTVKEFDVLYLLASNPGFVFSKEQIYDHIWNHDYRFATTSVFDHISSIRQKLGLGTKDKEYIQTIYGIGYRFAEN